MEFEDEHEQEEQEEEEEEDDDEDITIPPPAVPPSYVDSVVMAGVNSNQHRVTPPPSTDSRRSGPVRYRACLKNHAVNIGGHAVDGCGEFMPAGDDGTLDALKCAACNCHRNFHRKEVSDVLTTTPPPPPINTGIGFCNSNTSAAAGTTTMYPQFSAYYRTPAPPQSAGYLHMSAHHRPTIPALPSSNTSGGTHSGDMGDDMSHPSSSGGGGMMSGSGSMKKRHRTKFTEEQKDKMLGFAEKLGWRIQKHDEVAVQQFCAETQVKRQVLKVWMHNNKHTLGKRL